VATTALTFGGTATVRLVPGLAFQGTVSADRSATTEGQVLTGTATGNWSLVGPWLASDRQNRMRVELEIGGAWTEMTGLFGQVTIDEDTSTTAKTAQLTIIDRRASFFHDDSIVRGGIPVRIYFWSGDDVDEAEWLAFEGTLEASANDDTNCPRA
jgi:hypothetical protein